MPAKDNHQPNDAKLDVTAYTKANAAANTWASKAIELRAAGRQAEAKAAEKRAMLFLQRLLELEARYPHIARHPDRSSPGR